MNKLKKVGLSALAGSLVATSAYAGEMAVSGSAKLTYVDKQQNSGHTGTPFGMNKLLGFSGSGEMDNGNTVSVYFGNNGTSQSSATLSYDMGDTGKFMYDSGAGDMVLVQSTTRLQQQQKKYGITSLTELVMMDTE